MIPLSGWVLLAAAVVTSPALWSSLVDRSMPLDVALTRYLLATAGCWVVLSLVSGMVWPASTPQPPGAGGDAPDPVADDALERGPLAGDH